MFKLKFKMHKLVNIIFYFIIFVIGFLFGIGGKYIEEIFDLFNSLM